MKKFINNLLLVSTVLLALACGKEQGPAWTDAQYNSAVNACRFELLSPPARLSDEKATKACNCLISEVKSRWTYQQYQDNAASIDRQLDVEGRTNYCLSL